MSHQRRERVRTAALAARGAVQYFDEEWDEYLDPCRDLRDKERTVLRALDTDLRDPEADEAQQAYEALLPQLDAQLNVVQEALIGLGSAAAERRTAYDAAFRQNSSEDVPQS
jgi:hypothetical protein